MTTFFFETRDDGLAAFLLLQGVRRTGLGIGMDALDLRVSHAFDDDEAKITPLVARYQDRVAEVNVARFLEVYGFVRGIRLDEELRLKRQAAFECRRSPE